MRIVLYDIKVTPYFSAFCYFSSETKLVAEADQNMVHV